MGKYEIDTLLNSDRREILMHTIISMSMIMYLAKAKIENMRQYDKDDSRDQ